MEIKRYGEKEFLSADKLYIRENEIHIWCIRWSEMTDFWKNHEYILSGQELEQAGRFRFPEDRMRYIAGKVVVRILLKRYLDMETIDFPDKYDLIAGSSAIQWLEDFPLFLKKINRSLSDKGFVAISTFGEKNLIEIKQVTNIGLSYFTKSDLEHIISSSFQIIKMKEEIKTVYFSSPKDVLLHLKRSGVNGIASEKWTKSDFLYFTDRYNRLFKSDYGVPLTYHPIYIIASKKQKS